MAEKEATNVALHALRDLNNRVLRDVNHVL